jgi:hypothetical protein
MAAPLRPITFRLDADLIAGLQQVKTRDGIPVSEQVRRAVRWWLKEKGVTVKTDRTRAATRTRS